MNKTQFVPSINGIYFKNYKCIQSSDFSNHIKGDIYYKNRRVGRYNPLYRDKNHLEPTVYLQVNDKITQQYTNYVSIFAKNYLHPENNMLGVEELIKDLEFITYLYEFMYHINNNNDFENADLIGIINNESMQVIAIKDKSIRDYKSIKYFINQKIQSFKLDDNYPIHFFKSYQDFTL